MAPGHVIDGFSASTTVTTNEQAIVLLDRSETRHETVVGPMAYAPPDVCEQRSDATPTLSRAVGGDHVTVDVFLEGSEGSET